MRTNPVTRLTAHYARRGTPITPEIAAEAVAYVALCRERVRSGYRQEKL